MIDVMDYRNALGSFATGVTIVTVFDKEKQPWGLTANSFTSVSLDPPIISVCVSKSGRVFPILASSDHFAVNILSANQKDLALHFASTVENRFAETNWETHGNVPLLPEASAHLECQIQDRVVAGDHEILLGRVHYYEHNPVPPLVYCRGSFFPAPQTETFL